MIALISDFGLRDIYVGVMKSVIQSIAPQTVVIDITHDIAPQDIRAGSFALRGALPTLPAGAVAVVVVDPGVGTARLPIAVRSGKSWIVAPNNGLITGVAFDQAVVLDKHEMHRPVQASSTFHGRDIFAPVAAHLHLLQDLGAVGTPIDAKTLISLERPTLSRTDSTLIGEAQHIDRFGNIITNITPDILTIWASETSRFTLACGSAILPAKRAVAYCGTDASEDLLLIPSSFGLIEVAAPCADAAARLGGVKVGQSITIKRV